VRVGVLLAVAVAGALVLIAAPRFTAPDDDRPRLAWVATAHQFGPVGYRDPAGAISPDARWIAYSEGRFLRVRSIDGGPSIEFPPGDAQIRRLAWDASGRAVLTDGGSTSARWARYDIAARTREPVATEPDFREGACIDTSSGERRILNPCAGAPVTLSQPLTPYGPVAVSPNGDTLYFAAPNGGGTVDLWSIPAGGGNARQLTSFARDTYAPTVAHDGSVLFKVQSYRTLVARAPATGGASESLTTFQSETPSWHPGGALIGITYGTWRRVVDDAKYPDIAQEAGVISVNSKGPADAVAQVVDDSPSEDQSLCWSPNGRWIAYHSHKDQSDDIWLRPADGSAAGRRVSFLGRGAETGWPRWSPDGRWIIFTGSDKTTGHVAIHVIGIDEHSGEVTRQPRTVPVLGAPAGRDVFHAEWIGSDTLAVIAKDKPGAHVIFTLPREGGDARIVHRFASEHDHPGLAVSPDGKDVAFVAPAPDGFFQIFRMSLSGGSPQQVTTDRSNKTQPAWSPDGRTIAFTVWNYEAQFWRARF